MNLNSMFTTLDQMTRFTAETLLDSDCMGSCIDEVLVIKEKLRNLPRPIPIYNADGTRNISGSMSKIVTLHMMIDDHHELLDLAVTNLGKPQVFIGFEWLNRHNPNIDWQKGSILFNRCPDACGYQRMLARHVNHDDKVIRDKYLEPGESILIFNSAELVDCCHQINQVATKAQELAEQAFKEKKKKSFEEIVPTEYHEFRSVFAKESFDELPPF